MVLRGAWQCVAVRGGAWRCVAVRGGAWRCELEADVASRFMHRRRYKLLRTGDVIFRGPTLQAVTHHRRYQLLRTGDVILPREESGENLTQPAQPRVEGDEAVGRRVGRLQEGGQLALVGRDEIFHLADEVGRHQPTRLEG